MFFVLLAATLTSSAIASSPNRMVVEHDSSRGLKAGQTAEIVQDEFNLIYVSTGSGVLRFDGRHWARIGGPGLDIPLWWLAPAVDGVWAAERTGRLWRIRQNEGHQVQLPASVQGVRSIASTADHELLIVTFEGDLWLQHDGWSQPLLGQLLPGEQVRHVVRHDNYAVVLTTRGVFVLTEADATRRVTLPKTRGLVDAVVLDDGQTWVLPWFGALERYDAQGTLVDSAPTIGDRGIRLVTRGELLVASYANHLVTRKADAEWQTFGVEYGGTLLVDNERSTWMAGPGGVFQWPELDTQVFDRPQGLVSPHVRWIQPSLHGVWISTWAGVQHMSGDGQRLRTPSTETISRDRVCTGSDGRSWTHGIERSDADRTVHLFEITPDLDVVVHEHLGVTGCAIGSEGSVWIGGGDTWLWIAADAPPHPVNAPPPPRAHPLGIDAQRRLWATEGEHVCHTDRPPEPSRDLAWRCTQLDGARLVTDLVTMDGQTWISTENAGIYRVDGDQLQPVPEARHALGSLNITSLEKSADGGMWVTGSSPPARIDLTTFEVLERLTQWHGLPIVGAGDLIEGPTGDVWIATSRGVIRVPRSARKTVSAPPLVSVTRVRVDAQAHAAGQVVHVPADANLVELDFAAASFRDPSRVRYRVDMVPGGTQELSTPQLHLFDLPAGPVYIEMSASLDGVSWTKNPARVRLVVARPWWQHPAVWIVFTLSIGLLLFTAYRARLSFLLSQERQRLRIAMDLHDEMGSGLGSVGLLAGVLAQPELSDDERQALADRVTNITAELGGALHDIVWSLRPGGATLRSLMSRLDVRGHDLFADERAHFELQTPDPVPAQRLSLPVRRNLERMCQEAMHNASKHSGAANVVVGLDTSGASPRLWVHDDGVGFDVNQHSEGLGLESLRRRAQRIGATLQIDSHPDRGTTVHITFSPLAADRREAHR